MRLVPYEERNDDTEHYIVWDACRKILFINPSIEVLRPQDYASEEGVKEFLSYLYNKRGIYFATSKQALRIRAIMLKTWMPERNLCKGYSLAHLLPPLP